MTKKNDDSTHQLYNVFYKITRNLFYAYILITLLAVIGIVGYGYVLHAFFDDSALWEYLGSLIL